MITLITGAPGSGKSAALVSMLAELSQNRPLYCNGIPGLKVPHVDLEKPENWPSDVPDGAIVVIDEVQRIWRPRGPGVKVPDHVAKLETHRHRGLDFYIITQGPNLVDTNVRALVGRHVHLRDLGILGRWWYEWPETCDNCRTGWKNAPIKKRYRLPKRIFDQYKSASIHVKPVRSVPWMLAVMVGALVATGTLSWVAYKGISKRLAPVEAVKTPATTVAGMPPSAVPVAARPAPAINVGPVDERVGFMPRLSGRPWTAPAFDAVRQVVRMPAVAGAICTSERCVCVTDAGERLDLADHECREWLKLRPFDPYREPPRPVASSAGAVAGTAVASSPASAPGTAPVPQVSATVVPMPSGVSNPRADSLLPSPLPPGSPVHPGPPMGVLTPIAQGLL